MGRIYLGGASSKELAEHMMEREAERERLSQKKQTVIEHVLKLDDFWDDDDEE